MKDRKKTGKKERRKNKETQEDKREEREKGIKKKVLTIYIYIDIDR